MKIFWGLCLVVALFLGGNEAVAGQLAERLASFPDWDKPVVQVAKGDLVYPDWMAGTWNVKSTLIDAVAPLAPDIVTPGFESNRQNLQQPVSFQVRFGKDKLFKSSAIVADRAFNGLSLAKAYLGNTVIAVKVDPKSPNRQITLLKGDRQLVSIVSGRATEKPKDDQFITTEVFQQFFRAAQSRPYFNEVESTTAYQYLPQFPSTIEADQVTAVFLSPQDPDYPDYFATASRPVALYRYRLEFSPVNVPKTQKKANG